MDYKVRSTSNDWKARSGVRKPNMDYKVRSTSNDWKVRSEVRNPKHGLQGTLDIKRLESQIRSKKTKTWTTRYARHQTIGKPDQE